MTREEIEKELKESHDIMRSYDVDESESRLMIALNMAIQALQAQADGEYISKSDMIDWLKDIRHKMKPQNYHTASEFEVAENQIWNLIQMLQMGALPTVAIPSALTTEDYTELRDRFGEYVEFVVRDMVSGKGERWERKGVAIPSAEPKTGHWIYDDECHEHGHCSECGYGRVDLVNGEPHNFCRRCGARMVEQERSDKE